MSKKRKSRNKGSKQMNEVVNIRRVAPRGVKADGEKLDKTLSVRVKSDFHAQFEQVAASEFMNATELLDKLAKDYVTAAFHKYKFLSKAFGKAIDNGSTSETTSTEDEEL